MSNIIHFSVDDCIEMFRDITVNNYDSLFDSKYFSFFKYLHDRYKACISLYTFIDYKGFNISNTSIKYKKEFSENSNWLKIGFYGYNENSRYNSNKNIASKDYKLFLKYVYRFTGSRNIIDHIPRLHCFSADINNIYEMKKIDNGIIGALTADDDRDNYYLKTNENIFLNKHGEYKDIKNNILFIKTTLRIENISDIDITINNINLNNNIIMFTHENFLDNNDIKNNITKIYDHALKNDYNPNFIENISMLESINLDRIKKFIDCYIPVTTCNLKCQYCYITQSNRWSDALPEFKYSAEHVRKALSKDRLGGVCMLNMCAGGETLLHKYIIDLLRELLYEGHYIWVITNGILTKRFEEIISFPKELLYRLAFKFSFHYFELKRLNKLEEYVKNVKMVHEHGCSFSIEITPHDELIEYIDEIKEFCYKNFGALCHITVARADNTSDKHILTNLSKENYRKVWSAFNSSMFSFKLSTFLAKRREYCYAGKWSYSLNIGTGIIQQCYSSNEYKNIFDDIYSNIELNSIGKKCLEPHCYNSHAFLTFGDIPSLDTPYYEEMRNRVCEDGSEWLNPYMKEFCSHKLIENNKRKLFFI